MGNPLTPIPVDELPEMLGKLIHLSWAHKGCVWRLLKINGDQMELITPRTGRRRFAKVKDACYTRLHEPEPVETANV